MSQKMQNCMNSWRDTRRKYLLLYDSSFMVLHPWNQVRFVEHTSCCYCWISNIQLQRSKLHKFGWQTLVRNVSFQRPFVMNDCSKEKPIGASHNLETFWWLLGSDSACKCLPWFWSSLCLEARYKNLPHNLQGKEKAHEGGKNQCPKPFPYDIPARFYQTTIL
jgi:hypothetical protein